jgi:REP element-mobilizing transposase RayT
MKDKFCWHTRGYLPHIDQPWLIQAVTFRLVDAMPKAVIQKWQRELSTISEDERKRLIHERITQYEDAGHGSCVLAREDCSLALEQTMMKGHGQDYILHAWVIMPNHVHVIIGPPVDGTRRSLSGILQSWKGASARAINQLTETTGTLWQRDSFDRWIRNEDHFIAALRYIRENPVKAGLCQSWQDWPRLWIYPKIRDML